MLLLYCRIHVSSPSTNFCLVVGQGNSFLSMENTQRFCPGEGRCKFLHKYEISLGGGGGEPGNKFPGQPSGLSIFAKIFLREKQSRPDLMME